MGVPKSVFNIVDCWVRSVAVPASTPSAVEPSQPSATPQKKRLTEGHMMRCPSCELLRDPLDQRQFRRLERNEEYADELNVVYVCVRHTGGCGHVFSPGDQSIIRAYLSGDLVPANRQNGK